MNHLLLHCELQENYEVRFLGGQLGHSTALVVWRLAPSCLMWCYLERVKDVVPILLHTESAVQ